MSRTAKLTDRSLHLMREVKAGRGRIFYLDARPPGFIQAERAGYLTRVEGTDSASLTPAGHLFLEACQPCL